MDCRAIIEDIRAQYTGLKDMPRRSLLSAVSTLAKDLYSKDIHFVFELIQNAEDNAYLPGVAPSLRFLITTLELEGSTTKALVVLNNEHGFNEAHVRALCQIGQTTKKIEGYIGEKGIGFKSVFKVTSCPYVFSNGFQFALPEDDPEIGLGYIVPRWVDSLPAFATQARTCLILPFNKPDCDPTEIVESFKMFQPETLLFLRKLKTLEISIETPGNQYNVIIEKVDSQSPLVNLTVCRETQNGNSLSTDPFWVVGRELDRPEKIHADRRSNVVKTTATVAIPLGLDEHLGSCFAYLPVWQATGLPFAINADFLLVSSREGIREDDVWNQWLRDEVGRTYAEAFLSAVRAEMLTQAQRLRVYASLPTASHIEFLKPIVENIYEQLKDTECIITSRNISLACPKDSRIVPKKYRQLFEPDAEQPVPLPTGLHFVHSDIVANDSLRKLDVSPLLQHDVLECLTSEVWLNGRTHAWFVRLYRALQKFEKVTLLKRPILPVTALPEERPVLTCADRHPVYFPVSDAPTDLLGAVPLWLSSQIPLSFLQVDLYKLIKEQNDADELLKWMTDALNVYDFSIQKYCVNIIHHLAVQESVISTQQLIDATRFLSQYAEPNTDWGGLLIIVADGRRMLLSAARKIPWGEHSRNQVLVVPEGKAKEKGWHHIWSTPEDRQHFVALHACYKDMPTSWFAAAGIKSFPGFVPSRYTYLSRDIPAAEAMLMRDCKRLAAGSRSAETTVHSWLSPRTFLDDRAIMEETAHALLAFLCTLPAPQPYNLDIDLYVAGLRAEGVYQNYGKIFKYCPSTALLQIKSSRWLPSTKGFVRPNQAFLPNQGIKDVLGDTVPYFIGDLPEWIQRELGIKQEVSVAALLDTLKSYQEQSAGDLKMTNRVYTALHACASPGEFNLKSEFEKYSLVYLPGAEGDPRWLKPSGCIWADSSHVFGTSFACLEKTYPALRDFFVKVLAVKENVDTECYARRWLELQGTHTPGDAAIRPVLEKLYQSIIGEVRSAEHSPWWGSFCAQAKLYTQNDSFETPDYVFVPDDGNMKKHFQNTVRFVWRPPNDSFDDWQDLYAALGSRRLTESVSVTVDGNVSPVFIEKNQYLTSAAVQMIASWLREKRPPLYESRINDGTLHDLKATREAAVDAEITLSLLLQTPNISTSVPVAAVAHWERAMKELIIFEHQHVSCRLIAESIARGLSDARTFHDLADWVELVLGAQDTKRLGNRGWSVPREMLSEMVAGVNGQAHIQEPTTITPATGDVTNDYKSAETLNLHEISQHVAHGKADAAKLTPPNRAEGKVLTSALVNADLTQADDRGATPKRENTVDSQMATAHESVQYTDMLTQAFTRLGKTHLDTSLAPPDGSMSQDLPNSQRRRERIGALHRTRIADEPPSEDRRNTTERILLEPADPLVRTQLNEWYHGRCQLCDEGTEPWPEHNGQPFFVSARLVERSNARWLDDVANAVCLCAKHFAQWRHAAKEGPVDIVQVVQSLDPSTNPGSLKIPVALAGESIAIRYCPKHFIALQELIRASQNHNDESLG